MTKPTAVLPLGIMVAVVWGCATVELPDYSRFIAEDPHSIVVVPVMNNSPEVGADEYFLATITVPIAERGYYIFPVNMTRELLKDSGLSDPGLVHEAEGRWADAGAAHEAASAVAGFPVRNLALVEAIRCYADAGDSGKALELFDRLQNESPEQQVPPNTQARMRELRAAL